MLLFCIYTKGAKIVHFWGHGFHKCAIPSNCTAITNRYRSYDLRGVSRACRQEEQSQVPYFFATLPSKCLLSQLNREEHLVLCYAIGCLTGTAHYGHFHVVCSSLTTQITRLYSVQFLVDLISVNIFPFSPVHQNHMPTYDTSMCHPVPLIPLQYISSF